MADCIAKLVAGSAITVAAAIVLAALIIAGGPVGWVAAAVLAAIVGIGLLLWAVATCTGR